MVFFIVLFALFAEFLSALYRYMYIICSFPYSFSRKNQQLYTYIPENYFFFFFSLNFNNFRIIELVSQPIFYAEFFRRIFSTSAPSPYPSIVIF